MSMLLKDFVNDVHDNAVQHGFWESKRPIGETIALIHSELSEALEEYRAGRANVWFACNEVDTASILVCDPQNESDCLNYGKEESCPHRSPKPEGICIELLDAVIRIFDYLGQVGATIKDDVTIQDIASHTDGLIANRTVASYTKKEAFPEFIAALHYHLSMAYNNCFFIDKEECANMLFSIACVIITYVNAIGEDVEGLLLMKHNFNKTRPYKHGKTC